MCAARPAPSHAFLGGSLVMGRNAFDPFREQIGGPRMADIAETEDAYHPLVLADDWQPANLQLFHVPHGLGEVIVFTATMDFRGHHIPRRSIARIEVVLCQSFAHD